MFVCNTRIERYITIFMTWLMYYYVISLRKIFIVIRTPKWTWNNGAHRILKASSIPDHTRYKEVFGHTRLTATGVQRTDLLYLNRVIALRNRKQDTSTNYGKVFHNTYFIESNGTVAMRTTTVYTPPYW